MSDATAKKAKKDAGAADAAPVVSGRMPQDVVLRPVVTEKTLRLAEKQNAYTFRVAENANKVQIRDAIQRLFDVSVTDVRTSRQLGKFRRMGRSFGRTSPWKRAVVKVKAGDSIEFY
ncbi:MAG: 50S ribosomal protein L23 [Planctomycetota bacterium]